MIQRNIKDDEDDGVYSLSIIEDVENVDPLLHFTIAFTGSFAGIFRSIARVKAANYPPDIVEKVVYKLAYNDCVREIDQIKQIPIPEFLLALIGSSSKSEQKKILKDVSMTSQQLLAFIFHAGNNGFLYSSYSTQKLPNGTDRETMPDLVEIRDGNVKKIGSTTLSDSQLKQVVDHRNGTISKFLHKDDEWHCFFLTYYSIKGKESWKDGQPHYHYISDKFGMSRERVVEQLKSSNYKLGNLPHIDLFRNR